MLSAIYVWMLGQEAEPSSRDNNKINTNSLIMLKPHASIHLLTFQQIQMGHERMLSNSKAALGTYFLLTFCVQNVY